MSKYTIEIFYSEEDEGYIAVVPELPGCSAFGETEEEALTEIEVAMGLWLETARKESRPIPQPQSVGLLRAVATV
jgi:predicted RNase H-like HicB family nuclease